VCGDEIKLQLRIEGDVIESARFVGTGCSISQAAVSMMTGLITGKKLSDAEALTARFTRMMHGDAEAAQDRRLGDLRALQGVSKFPIRIKCALIGFDALQEALERTGGEESP
jgi:nitrogen fixation NifU-like protein